MVITIVTLHHILRACVKAAMALVKYYRQTCSHPKVSYQL